MENAERKGKCKSKGKRVWPVLGEGYVLHNGGTYNFNSRWYPFKKGQDVVFTWGKKNYLTDDYTDVAVNVRPDN